MPRPIPILLSVAALVLAAAAPAAADTGLVGDWPFDEGAGSTTADVSGQGDNGALSGNIQWVAGRTGTALAFDGATARVQVLDAPALEPNQITVQAWVKRVGSPGNFKYIVAKGGNDCSAASYSLYSGPNGGLMFYVSTNDGLIFTRSPDAGVGVWDGNWHLATGTYDGSTVRLYIDGVQVGSGTPWSNPISYGLPTNDLFFGHDPTCSGFDFSGSIDEPKIWDRALSPQEVLAQYRPCPTGTKANFRWHYSANGSSGSWSGTATAVCPASLAMGPQAMEGDLKVSPGTTLTGGYDFTVPGNNSQLSVSVISPQVVFGLQCASGATPSQTTLVLPMLGQNYSVSGSPWLPSGDQHSPLAYQGSVVVPDVCGGGQVRLNQGGKFTASVS